MSIKAALAYLIIMLGIILASQPDGVRFLGATLSPPQVKALNQTSQSPDGARQNHQDFLYTFMVTL
jgi:hypothetical protein